MQIEFTLDVSEIIAVTWIACGLVAFVGVAFILRDRA